MRRASGLDFARNSLLIPCAPKKFPARAKKFPARSRREFIRKRLNSQMFSRRIFAKKRLIRRNSPRFSLRPGNSGLKETLRFRSTASLRGADRRERGMPEKHATSSRLPCAPRTRAGDGHDGRRFRLCEAKPKPSTVRPRNVAMASKLPVRPKAGARLSSPPPPQPRDEEAVEPGLPRGRRRQMAGQRAHVALRSDAFGHAADLARLDRLAANVGIAAQQRGNLALALLGLQRARAIDDRASRPGERDRAVEQVGLQLAEGGDVYGTLGPGDVGVAPNGAGGGARRIEQRRGERRRLEGQRVGDDEFGLET